MYAESLPGETSRNLPFWVDFVKKNPFAATPQIPLPSRISDSKSRCRKTLTTKDTKVTKESQGSGCPALAGLAGEWPFAQCMRPAHADISHVVREQVPVPSPQRVLNPCRLGPCSSSCSLCSSWLRFLRCLFRRLFDPVYE